MPDRECRRYMNDVWSTWKRFPDPQKGESLQAPIGPGIYEVRHIASGEVIAFDYATHVARALSDLVSNGQESFLWKILRRERIVLDSHELGVSHLCGVHQDRSKAGGGTIERPAPGRPQPQVGIERGLNWLTAVPG